MGCGQRHDVHFPIRLGGGWVVVVVSSQDSGHSAKPWIWFFFFFLIYFGCAESSLLPGHFSSCSKGERGLLASCSVSTSHCCGFSCRRAQAPGHMGFSSWVHGLSCPAVCGIFLARWNPCLLHWQVDSLPLSPQGSPGIWFLPNKFVLQSCCEDLMRQSGKTLPPPKCHLSGDAHRC